MATGKVKVSGAAATHRGYEEAVRVALWKHIWLSMEVGRTVTVEEVLPRTGDGRVYVWSDIGG